ncbi:hypothetical protein J2755_000229 [Methanohalophilus levihalophilus]|uniref:DUF4389 domain-containing protein n=1 Tax=Methanohalophilus levihalophilus TaxID=1431282 RepID=UPI001AE78B81|nr:DUF4389 domain-containing protein [Methanohalophilus levihalophilus]MBP2029309.1 hypothetical protein [Methanohalophilus levihalophilus]
MNISNGVQLEELFAYEKKASRIELFIRLVYTIPIVIVLYIYSILAGICLLLQWIIILIAGRRIAVISNVISGYLRYYTHIAGYVYLTSDKRPGIMPPSIAIYEKKLYYEKDTTEVIHNGEDV